MQRLLTAIAFAVFGLALAGGALAHARLIVATPRGGSTVTAPRQLKLTYSESIVPNASQVLVTGPGGTAISSGPLTINGANKRIVTVPFTAKLGGGAYRVTWHMTSEDGHETDGDFTFLVKP